MGEAGSDEGGTAPPKRGGPKTAAGKAVVRRNPIKHGVLAQTPVIGLVERGEDWAELRSGIFAYFDVEGAMEEELADRIAGYAWRLRRASRAETGAVSQGLHDVPDDWRFDRELKGLPRVRQLRDEHVEEMNKMLMKRLLPDEGVMDRIGRYEKSLHRQMLQSIQQLLVLKSWTADSRQRTARDGRTVVSVKGFERRGVTKRVARSPLDGRGRG